MTEPTDISPEDSAQIAEYALGLLTSDEAAAVEARLRAEPALAADLVHWQRHFAALADEEVTAVAPRPALVARIEREIFGPPLPRVWSPVAVWRSLAVTGLATSVALGLILMLQTVPAVDGPPVERPQALVAQLDPVSGDSEFVAVYDEQAATLRIRQAAGTAAPGRAQELWAIVDDAAPVSLGLLAEEGGTTVVVPDDLRDALAGAVLAVSDEPPGGSPTGAPTGDVLAAGSVLEL